MASAACLAFDAYQDYLVRPSTGCLRHQPGTVKRACVQCRPVNRSLFLGSLLAFAAASTYGLSYVTARWAYDEGTDAQTINGLRLAALALFNAVWVSASGAKFTVSWYAFFGSVWTGFFMFVGGAGNLGAIQYIPVSLAILVFYTYPLQTLLFASVLDRRWPRRTDYLAILLSLAGLALALALLQLYGTLSGFRTSWTFILVGHVLYTLPFMVRSVLAVLMAMDFRSLEESAATLGASAFTRFRTVIIPNAMPISGGLETKHNDYH